MVGDVVSLTAEQAVSSRIGKRHPIKIFFILAPLLLTFLPNQMDQHDRENIELIRI
jgi:hypothetical protein